MTTVDQQETAALIQVQPALDDRVRALYKEGVKLKDYALTRVIEGDDDIKVATNDLSIIAGVKKAIEEKRRGYTVPLNDFLKAINAAFKDFVTPLEEADTITRRKVLDYRKEQERIRLEQEHINRLREEAAQAEMALRGEITEPVGLVEVQPAVPERYRTETGLLSGKKTWEFQVEDFSLLPDDYKVPDMVKIRKVVIAGATIPGVRSWKAESLRVTPQKPQAPGTVQEEPVAVIAQDLTKALGEADAHS